MVQHLAFIYIYLSLYRIILKLVIWQNLGLSISYSSFYPIPPLWAVKTMGDVKDWAVQVQGALHEDKEKRPDDRMRHRTSRGAHHTIMGYGCKNMASLWYYSDCLWYGWHTEIWYIVWYGMFYSQKQVIQLFCKKNIFSQWNSHVCYAVTPPQQRFTSGKLHVLISILICLKKANLS